MDRNVVRPRTYAEGREVIKRVGRYPEQNVAKIEPSATGWLLTLSCGHQVLRFRRPNISQPVSRIVCDRCAEE